MSSASPDLAPSDSFIPPPRPTGDAAAADPWGRVQLRRWLGQLVDIGYGLVERMGGLVASRQVHGPSPYDVDVPLGVALVTRAMRWLWALQARLRTEPVAAYSALESMRESGADRSEFLDLEDPPYRRPVLPPRPDACIAGLSVAQIVRQINADLSAAADLSGDEKSLRRIAKIAEAVRELLDDWEPPWTGLLPPPVVRGRLAPDAAAFGAVAFGAEMPGAADAEPVLAPDSG